ncbi:MAG: HIT family protein [Candidatus Micrarchaeia archaeon]
MGCPFCSRNGVIIAENKYAYAILDMRPIHRGHILVVPKKHYECITEIPLKELTGVMSLIKDMERRLIKRMGAHGLTIRQNWAPFLKENHLVVRHLHFHIIPRHLNDKLATPVKRMRPSKRELEKVAKMLR